MIKHPIRGGLALALLAAAGAQAAESTPFDARDPAALTTVLASMEATATVARKTDDAVYLNVKTPAYAFGVQFAGCNDKGKACQGLAFSTASETRTATLAQINGFNQTSINCRVFQDKGGKPHISYSTLLSASDTRDEMRMHIGAWQGCVGSFGAFLADPPGFLAEAP